MLSNVHMHEELEKAENIDVKDDLAFRSTIIKLMSLQIKLLHNIRTNQTQDMKARGIDLRKDKDNKGKDA